MDGYVFKEVFIDFLGNRAAVRLKKQIKILL